MEVDEIQNQGCKFPRISNGNGRFDNKRDGQDDGLEVKRISTNGVGGLCGGWPSSRIVRVSRASGGKDRHSKVWTSKGLRDRRVRLSVNTAIQFYDLQDRLGYDQPSKAVEWLLKAAAPSISELPSLNGFPDTQREISEDKRSSTGTHEQGLDSAEVEIDAGDPNCNQQQQLSKSACSSTSETSKGSALSLSRSESRVKARERARERAAEKEKEKENVHSSFTELLTGGMNNNNNNNVNTTSNNGRISETNFFCKSPRHWSASPFEYFSSGLLGPRGNDNSTSSFPTAQIHLGNPIQQPLSMSSSPMFSISGDHHHHPELHHFPFVNDHLAVPVVSTGCGTCNGHANNEYNLNFSISSSSSSGLAGYNRGTLQSNSSSLLPHFQRYYPIEGTQSFFNATTANTAAAAAVVAASVDDHHHNFLSAYDARLQLFYGDEHGRDQKGKGKN